jgi:hypothetical protein
MVQSRCRVMLEMVLPSHALDGTTEVTRPRCDVHANDHANMTPGLICM